MQLNSRTSILKKSFEALLCNFTQKNVLIRANSMLLVCNLAHGGYLEACLSVEAGYIESSRSGQGKPKKSALLDSIVLKINDIFNARFSKMQSNKGSMSIKLA